MTLSLGASVALLGEDSTVREKHATATKCRR